MNAYRYLNSFLITSSIYSLIAFLAFFTFFNTIIKPTEDKQSFTKISLNSISIEKPQEVSKLQPILQEPKVEPKIEPIVEKVKPKPKTEPIKKIVEKPVEKPITKPIEKVVEQKNEITQEVINAPITNTLATNTQVTNLPTATNTNQTQIDNLKAKYLSKVQAVIEKNKVYPKSAKRLNQTGKVEVNFDIMENGEIKNVKISKKSLFEKLDLASIELLLKIGNFDEIPKELQKSVWNISIPIDYQLK